MLTTPLSAHSSTPSSAADCTPAYLLVHEPETMRGIACCRRSAICSWWLPGPTTDVQNPSAVRSSCTLMLVLTCCRIHHLIATCTCHTHYGRCSPTPALVGINRRQCDRSCVWGLCQKQKLANLVHVPCQGTRGSLTALRSYTADTTMLCLPFQVPCASTEGPSCRLLCAKVGLRPQSPAPG